MDDTALAAAEQPLTDLAQQINCKQLANREHAKHTKTIERGLCTFIQVGAALKWIRDNRTYKNIESFETFEAYCAKRWDMNRSRAYQLIDASEVTYALSTMVDIMPVTERQCRPLTTIPLDEVEGVWKQTVERVGLDDDGEQITPTAKDVKATVDAWKDLNKPETPDLPDGVFNVIVIDPPWAMEKIQRDCRPNQVDMDYTTMTQDELLALEVPASDDCHMWMWTTHRFLIDALALVEAWGFRYVCTFVWHKPGGYQPVGLPQYNCEFAVYARKGTPAFIDTKAFNVCFDAPRGKHSEKPEEFYDIVRRVTDGNRIDMFNRRAIEGFKGWGDEVGADA